MRFFLFLSAILAFVNLNAQNTLAPEPTMPAANLEITDIQETSARVSWESGDGVGRIVTIWEYGKWMNGPNDGSVANVNPSFPNGVVYHGRGNFVNLAKLSPGKTYSVAVYEFNGSGRAINYLNRPVVSGCFTTPKD